jgi:hypothetical protein
MPVMFHCAQSPQASAGPSQASPGTQRQLQCPPPEQSASVVQASAPVLDPDVVALSLSVGAGLAALEEEHPTRRLGARRAKSANVERWVRCMVA